MEKFKSAPVITHRAPVKMTKEINSRLISASIVFSYWIEMELSVIFCLWIWKYIDIYGSLTSLKIKSEGFLPEHMKAESKL